MSTLRSYFDPLRQPDLPLSLPVPIWFPTEYTVSRFPKVRHARKSYPPYVRR